MADFSDFMDRLNEFILECTPPWDHEKDTLDLIQKTALDVHGHKNISEKLQELKKISKEYEKIKKEYEELKAIIDFHNLVCMKKMVSGLLVGGLEKCWEGK